MHRLVGADACWSSSSSPLGPSPHWYGYDVSGPFFFFTFSAGRKRRLWGGGGRRTLLYFRSPHRCLGFQNLPPRNENAHTHILGFPKLRGVLQRRASLAALCTRPKLLIIGIWANLRATRLLLSLMGEDAPDGRILVCELRIGSSVFTYNCVCVSVSFHQKNFLLIDQCRG